MKAATSAPMQRALQLAAQAVGRTSPNPMVGAVIVKDGQIVGEGFYSGPGSPHAEVAALNQAGASARGATAYVTLEPCNHLGTTPPCADALVAAGISKVVFSIIDPDIRVKGAGRATLEAAGVIVEEGDGAAESSKLLEAYIKHRLTGLPFVVVKYAASLDGRIAARSGDSRWVSGPETLKWAHRERTKIDAIIVGSSTVVIDNPLLTARPEGVTVEHQPLRVVIDSAGRISPDANLLHEEGETVVATTEQSDPAWRRRIEAEGAEVPVFLTDAAGHVAPLPLLEYLGTRGVLTALVEGGGVIQGSFFDRRLVDKITAVIAPIIIGAVQAATPIAGQGAERMSDAIRLRDLTVERLGDDILVSGYPIWP
jgi:diaminohydroxyphosphoribosylaminopyrimidine deaminase/5-amino-6-(5-phosphoribosylamino)uracil reductase